MSKIKKRKSLSTFIALICLLCTVSLKSFALKFSEIEKGNMLKIVGGDSIDIYCFDNVVKKIISHGQIVPKTGLLQSQNDVSIKETIRLDKALQVVGKSIQSDEASSTYTLFIRFKSSDIEEKKGDLCFLELARMSSIRSYEENSQFELLEDFLDNIDFPHLKRISE